MLNERQVGFTLVEIAIVLLIVGLLIGGVLKVQEMIGQITIFSDIDGSIARILDRRLDDGAINTGRVRSALTSGGASAMNANTTPASPGYIDTDIFHVAFRPTR
jgi:prepilin-type N-terminal cleavage/methylation domain-containing protein